MEAMKWKIRKVVKLTKLLLCAFLDISAPTANVGVEFSNCLEAA